jgi:MraZ protein
MIFTGHAELTIDPKGRLAIPAKHRGLLRPERDGNAWYCVPWKRGLMMLFTEARFTSLAERGDATLTPQGEQAGAEANYFGLTERVEMDSAGRIVLPRLHQELTGLHAESDVVMIGAGPRLEVWEKKAWAEGLQQRFAQLPDLMRSLEQRASEKK